MTPPNKKNKGVVDTNIFFVHGPLVLVIVKRLLETNPDIKKSRNYCFIFFKERLDIELPYCDTFSFATKGFHKYISSQIKFKKILQKIESDNFSYNVFLPNPFHFSTNYALFSSHRHEALLLEEGLANYYEANIRTSDKYKMAAKALLGFITGLRYKPYSGHITAYETANYSSIYVFSDKLLLTNPGIVHLVPGITFDRSLPQKKNSIVILDQDIESLLSRYGAKTVRQSLHSYLETNSWDIIYYKKHPSQTKSTFGVLKNTIKNIQLIHSDLPIEMLVEDIKPTEVVSFTSSALVTLSDSYPDILCTAIGVNLFGDNLSKTIFDLFASRNINMIQA